MSRGRRLKPGDIVVLRCFDGPHGTLRGVLLGSTRDGSRRSLCVLTQHGHARRTSAYVVVHHARPRRLQ